MPRVVIVPAAPALVPEVAGATPDLDAVRQAAASAVRDALAASPRRVSVVASATHRATEQARLDLSPYVAGAPPAAPLPVDFLTAAWLLDEAGWRGPRVYTGVDASEEPTVEADDVVLLVADGTACRSERAPGHLDPRAEAFDARIASALAAGDARSLAQIDTALAQELHMRGAPALQWLARHVGDAAVTAVLTYDDAPLGVGTWVAVWTWDAPTPTPA